MSYVPGTPPRDFDSFWFLNELKKIADAIQSPSTAVRLIEVSTSPSKVLEGEVRIADGVHWNPGRGAGTYVYRKGEWQLIEAGQHEDASSLRFFLGD